MKSARLPAMFAALALIAGSTGVLAATGGPPTFLTNPTPVIVENPLTNPVPTTLMSAFPSSRRVNPWLHWKQLVQALPGKAGGTVVMATVDQTLMRGLEPHDR